MQARTKKRPTEAGAEVVVKQGRSSWRFKIPKSTLDQVVKYLARVDRGEAAADPGTVPADEVFSGLHAKYGKPGTVLRGFRARDGLTQVALASRLGVPQGDVSAMENGRRPIGKAMAKRLAEVFKVDYRVFL